MFTFELDRNWALTEEKTTKEQLLEKAKQRREQVIILKPFL